MAYIVKRHTQRLSLPTASVWRSIQRPGEVPVDESNISSDDGSATIDELSSVSKHQPHKPMAQKAIDSLRRKGLIKK